MPSNVLINSNNNLVKNAMPKDNKKKHIYTDAIKRHFSYQNVIRDIVWEFHFQGMRRITDEKGAKLRFRFGTTFLI